MKRKLEIHKIDVSSSLPIPYADEGIRAGFPSPAQDYMEQAIDLNKELIKHPASTFFGRVVGDSMRDEGIEEGDILVIDKSLELQDDDLAVCFIDGDFTVKRVRIEPNAVWLIPANPKYSLIKVTKENEFIVWGIVTYTNQKEQEKKIMFGLMDCNNFYASCERVFNPALNGKPIVVLSNNDGCVIARSNEAKALGIKMGVPAYQIKDDIQKYGISVFSSNYTLYGDMSGRVMSILAEQVPEMEVYSIDEAFLNLEGIRDIQSLGTDIINKVIRGTGIPVSLGIAPTKTLAKVANKFAKKYPAYNRLCIIDTEEKRTKALQLTEIGDIWGIGHRQVAKLEKQGVKTAYDFTELAESWVRKNMTVVGERTWKELQGISCIDMETTPPAKKQICTSRSFGKMVEDIDTMSEAIATHASTCAKKLRQQKGYAMSLMVFIHTNNFRKDSPQYWRNTVVHLPIPTNDTLEIVHYALAGLKTIFMQGYQYKKAGVIITEITDSTQLGLFDSVDREKRERLQQTIDKINGKHSRLVKLAIQGTGRNWKLKQKQLSGHYTTDINQIISINCTYPTACQRKQYS